MDQSLLSLKTILEQASDLVSKQQLWQVEEKSFHDYVTNVDRQLDAFLTEQLGKLTPGVPVLSEERPFSEVGQDFWIIDPLDGTHNFLAGIPFVGICAALFSSDGAELSAVADVHHHRIYSAKKNNGAFCNDKRLEMPEIPSSLIAISSGAMDGLIEKSAIYHQARGLGKVRNLGSQALQLCAVASGTLSVALSREAKFWDDAAARLIAEEAGAIYKSYSPVPKNPAPTAALSEISLHSLCVHPSQYEAAEKIASELWRDDTSRSNDVKEKET
jgi:myo-inositol-1(or 4)-monophosphatase